MTKEPIYTTIKRLKAKGACEDNLNMLREYFEDDEHLPLWKLVEKFSRFHQVGDDGYYWTTNFCWFAERLSRLSRLTDAKYKRYEEGILYSWDNVYCNIEDTHDLEGIDVTPLVQKLRQAIA